MFKIYILELSSLYSVSQLGMVVEKMDYDVASGQEKNRIFSILYSNSKIFKNNIVFFFYSGKIKQKWNV